ncbi:hypothetical protein ENUP19_0121G0123 [Entamoeba nuttalli]|uniref:Papain family cysteine protease domain containing protein n=1 Tax=Entamoeba nuttalli TaxID=412467 RepID=A0ABQ0DIU6_9EUKA
MGNMFLSKLSAFPITQKIAVILIFLGLIIQFGIMLYFRFAPFIKENEIVSTFEKSVGNVTDIASTYLNDEMKITIPSKARIPHGNPRYYQMERGTCWDFALIGFLEDSYRQNGIAKGFLEENEYVRFSTQVLGIRMVEHCKEHPDVCNTPGDSLLLNSTSGGEINWFYSFPGLYNQILPDSVCPYTPTDVDEFVCDKIEEATKTNPIKFNVTKMNIATTVEDVKKLFIQKGKKALAWTSLIHDDFEYFPCTEYADLCNSGLYEIIKCPIKYGNDNCVKITLPMYTPDAEFDRHEEMQMAGGHGMVMVGYNDEFVTKAGFKGGFILKNSWNDTIYGNYPGATGRNARGSHSIEYFMGEISYEEELLICPNAQDPLNWDTCYGNCYENNTENEFWMSISNRPYEFKCVNEKICSTDPVYRYFMKSLLPSQKQPNGRYFDICMIRVNSLDNSHIDLCYNALPTQVIALYYTPTDSQLQKLKPPHNDYCGYYFFPYDIVEQQQSYFGGFNCIYYDIDWDDSSYLKNMVDGFDYQYVNKSTGKQNFDEVHFVASAPFINQRY